MHDNRWKIKGGGGGGDLSFSDLSFTEHDFLRNISHNVYASIIIIQVKHRN